MREVIELDLKREEEIINISDRLKHKVDWDITKIRVRNRLLKDVALAKTLLETGELKAVGDVRCIMSKEDLELYINQIKKKGIYVLDLETTGLDVFNDIIVGVCIYVEGLPSAYIPINHTDIDNNLIEGQLKESYVKSKLKEIYLDSSIKTIGHNFKYDYKVSLWAWGLRIANVYFDTMIGAFLLNENEKRGLKPLYNKYILKGKGSDKDFGDYFGKIPFNYIPIEVATVYGANDGIKNWQLFLFQKKYLLDSNREDMKALRKVLFELEMPLTPLLADMELRGVEIREDFANELSEEMRKELVEVEKAMDDELEEIKTKILKNETLCRLTNETGKINYSSPEQLKVLLYGILKLKSGNRKNPTGTGVDILLILKEKYKLEFIDKLLRYRELNKLLTTYVEKLPRIVEPKTNAVHTQFNQTGADTGRFSSSDPITKLNLQNIPSKEKRIRKIFKARDGYLLVGGDFS